MQDPEGRAGAAAKRAEVTRPAGWAWLLPLGTLTRPRPRGKPALARSFLSRSIDSILRVGKKARISPFWVTDGRSDLLGH